MEPHRPDETEEETSEGGNHQSLITSAVVIGIVLALVAIIEVGGLQLWEWIQSLEEVAQQRGETQTEAYSLCFPSLLRYFFETLNPLPEL